MVGMTKSDRIIAELIDALDKIERKTHGTKLEALAYIGGVAKQAQANANTQRERNSDGYLVVKP
jgi:hypothetical protein